MEIILEMLIKGTEDSIIKSSFFRYEFFKDAGAVSDVRVAMDENGRSRGFGHVEFETEEGAEKALEKSGQSLEGREIFCDLARERGSAPQSGGKDWNSMYVFFHYSHSLFYVTLVYICI